MKAEKSPSLSPLSVGDLALRFRTRPGASRVSVVGVECVEVVAVSGNRVTWTNHKPTRAPKARGVAYRHTSDRRELIALTAFENLCAAPAEKSAVVSPLAGVGAAR